MISWYASTARLLTATAVRTATSARSTQTNRLAGSERLDHTIRVFDLTVGGFHRPLERVGKIDTACLRNPCLGPLLEGLGKLKSGELLNHG